MYCRCWCRGNAGAVVEPVGGLLLILWIGGLFLSFGLNDLASGIYRCRMQYCYCIGGSPSLVWLWERLPLVQTMPISQTWIWTIGGDVVFARIPHVLPLIFDNWCRTRALWSFPWVNQSHIWCSRFDVPIHVDSSWRNLRRQGSMPVGPHCCFRCTARVLIPISG